MTTYTPQQFFGSLADGVRQEIARNKSSYGDALLKAATVNECTLWPIWLDDDEFWEHNFSLLRPLSKEGLQCVATIELKWVIQVRENSLQIYPVSRVNRTELGRNPDTTLDVAVIRRQLEESFRSILGELPLSEPIVPVRYRYGIRRARNGHCYLSEAAAHTGTSGEQSLLVWFAETG